MCTFLPPCTNSLSIARYTVCLTRSFELPAFLVLRVGRCEVLATKFGADRATHKRSRERFMGSRCSGRRSHPSWFRTLFHFGSFRDCLKTSPDVCRLFRFSYLRQVIDH